MADESVSQGSPSPQYEFTREQNEKIRRLASSMGLFGMIVLALGVLIGVRVVVEAVRYFTGDPVSVAVFIYGGMLTLLLIPLGRCLFQSAAEFGGIIETKRHDIDHLMRGVEKLTSFFRPLVLIYLAIAALGLVLALLHLFGVIGDKPGVTS
jgi:hypothetical protein